MRRLPGNAHLSFPGATATRCSTCSTPPGVAVLDGLGLPGRGARSPATCCSRWASPRSDARGALRLTLGHTSTQADVDAFLAALPAAVERGPPRVPARLGRAR